VGASIIMSALQKGNQSIFLAHRRELIKQSFCKLVRSGVGPDDIGIIMADAGLGHQPETSIDPSQLDDAQLWKLGARSRSSAPVHIASIDTLRNRRAPPAKIVMIDEAHRALSPSYLRMLDIYTDAVHIGLTATPWRADGRGLEEYYQALVVGATPSKLIAEGFILEPRVFLPPREDLPDLSRIRIVAGDYDERQLSVAVDQDRLVGNIVDHWFREARGIRTVVFPTSIAHSKHLVERFNDAGARFEHLDGGTPARERDAILARLDRHEIDGVSSCDALSEGWDQPPVKCAILAKPTRSLTKYLQKAGRILRPCPGAPQPIILDHAGCSLDLNCLPQDDQDYSLQPPPKRKRSQAQVPRTSWCPKCWAMLPAGTKVCPRCGFVFPKEATPKVDVSESDGTLVEVRAITIEEKRQVWESLCRKAVEAGYADGWIRHQFSGRFGCKPPDGFALPKRERPPATDEEKQVALASLNDLAKAKGYKPYWVLRRFVAKFGCPPPKLEESKQVEMKT